jgi:hypothetical protein
MTEAVRMNGEMSTPGIAAVHSALISPPGQLKGPPPAGSDAGDRRLWLLTVDENHGWRVARPVTRHTIAAANGSAPKASSGPLKTVRASS